MHLPKTWNRKELLKLRELKNRWFKNLKRSMAFYPRVTLLSQIVLSTIRCRTCPRKSLKFWVQQWISWSKKVILHLFIPINKKRVIHKLRQKNNLHLIKAIHQFFKKWNSTSWYYLRSRMIRQICYKREWRSWKHWQIRERVTVLKLKASWEKSYKKSRQMSRSADFRFKTWRLRLIKETT